MAARSVNSQCRSRVIEHRNNDNVGAFVVRLAGAAPERREEPGAEVRPGSKSTARAHWGSQGTWETRKRPWGQTPEWMRPAQQHPGLAVADNPAAGSERGKPPQGIRRNVTNGVAGEAQGSLSGLIVPQKTRRTAGTRSRGVGKGHARLRNRRGETWPILSDRRPCQRNIGEEKCHIATGGTVCGKSASTGLWGSRRATVGSTRNPISSQWRWIICPLPDPAVFGVRSR